MIIRCTDVNVRCDVYNVLDDRKSNNFFGKLNVMLQTNI